MTEMMALADKDFKTVITNMLNINKDGKKKINKRWEKWKIQKGVK